MADITNEIQKIGQAVYGEEVRGAIMDALEAMNEQAAAAQEWATGEDDPTDEPGETNNAAYYAAQAAASATAAAGSAASGIAALANEAPTFDATTAYTAGEYVLYNSVLYRFTADHAAGAWTGNDAAEVKVGRELETNSNAINLQYNDNFWSYGTVLYNTGISSKSGANYSLPGYNTTDYIPVNPGDIIYGYGSRFCFYDADKVTINVTDIFNLLPTQLPSGNQHYCIVPEDAVYFRICSSLENNQFFTAKVNAFEYWLNNRLETVEGDTASLVSFKQTAERKIEYLNDVNLWNYGTYLVDYVISPAAAHRGEAMPSSGYDTTDFIPVTPGEIIYGRGLRFYCYDTDKVAIAGLTGVMNTLSTVIGYDNHYYVIPSGVSYFRCCIARAADVHFLAKVNAYEYWINSKIDDFDIGDIETRIDALEHPPKVKTLYAIGDSITRGMYAEYGASASTGPTPYNYVYWLGEINHYNVINLGESGGGYALKGSQTNQNGKDIVDNNTFENADIVTIAFGINDYKTANSDILLGSMNSPSGDGSVIGNMKYMIEQLYAKVPKASIIIMLPMNQNRFGTGLTFEDNWSFGYAFRENKTLADYRAAIKECAEYYNLNIIDEEAVTPLNRYNIRYQLGDGLHPTRAFYKRMAEAFAPFVN